jgi:NAD+ synthase
MNSIEASRVIKNIRTNFKAYMLTNKLQSVVLGISGGIDSALCAALLKPVMDQLNLPLIGVSLPHSSNKIAEIERATAIGEQFCTKFHEQPIIDSFEVLFESIGMICAQFDHNVDAVPDHKFRIHMGNIKARVRMIHLYGLAGLYNGMVISTDNLTELMLGFWTLHGDVGDYGPIQQLWKTEVYDVANQLLEEFNDLNKVAALRSCIECAATDGLGVSTTSLEQLGGKSFSEVDSILKQIVNSKFINGDETFQKVYDRHINSQYKRNNPYNIPREDLFKE